MNEFAKRLKQEREFRCWSQEQVAEMLETNANSVSRWERGISFPNPYSRQKLCKIFGKTAEEFGLLEAVNAEKKQTPELLGTERDFSSPPARTAMLLWNLPHQRMPHFTGRAEILLQIHSMFHIDSLKTPPVVAISGLAGIGKTELALEYVYRYSEAYQMICWTHAETRDALFADIATIASVLNLVKTEPQDRCLIVERVREWFDQHPSWLFVLDNLEEFSLLHEFLPFKGKGHILITTRSQSTGAFAQQIDLPKMDRDEGTLLLLRRAERIKPEETLEHVSDSELATARDIAQFLDGLPLALDQAGAYIEEAACSLSHYFDLLQRSGSRILNLRSLLDNKKIDHPDSIHATLSLVFSRLKRNNPAAMDLLQLCAFLHPEAIPEEMLLAGLSSLGPLFQPLASDPLHYDAIIAELRRYSLLHRKTETQTLSIHRLVQVVLKDTMDEALQRQWAVRAVQIVNHSFPEVDQWLTSNLCRRYLSQAQVCIALIDQWDIQSLDAGRLLMQLSCYMYEVSQYELTRYTQAEPLLQKALTMVIQLVGTGYPLVADTLQLLGWVYLDREDYAQAERYCQQALAIQERLPEPDYWRIACYLADLAELHEEQGKYVSAESLYQRAVEINEQVRGPEHTDVAINLRNWGRCYSRQKKYEQAEPLLLRALTIWQQNLGKEHQVTATIFYELGRLYLEQRQYDQAESFLLQAQEIRQKLLHPEHPQMISNRNMLARLYLEQEA